MPYKSIEDLPQHVRESLPEEAQEIFLTAYVSAWNSNDDPEDRRNEQTRAEKAELIAWAEVKKKYEKIGTSDEWRHRES